MTDAVPERGLSIFVNGESRSVSAGSTLGSLLRSLGVEPRRVAIAVNRDVLPRSQALTRRLASGDRVEILEAVGGG